MAGPTGAGPSSAQPPLTSDMSYMTRMNWLYEMNEEQQDFCNALPAEEQDEFSLYLLGRKAMILEGEGDIGEQVEWNQCT